MDDQLTEVNELTAYDRLLDRITTLEHAGDTTKVELNVTKLCSLGILASAGLTAIATVAGASALAVPIAVLGAAFYLPSVMQEGKATGGLRPLPFSATSLTGVLSQVDRSTRGSWQDEHELTGYAYLTPRQKAEYALISYAGDTLAPHLDALNPRDRERAWRRAVTLIAERFSDEIKLSPYALEHFSKQVLCDFALSPEKHGDLVAGTVEAQTIGTNTRLGAIDVPAIESASDSKKMTVVALQKRLASECPDLLLLVKAPPIRLVGLQRTGKSTFARKLALLRAILLPGHCVAWSTPHREADNLVPEALHPFGTTADGAKDFRAIESVWMTTQAAIDKGHQLNTTVVWDEFGSYDAFRNPEVLGVSLRSQLREATKHGYFPILVAHGDQANFYPGVTGILGTLRDSTIKVETIGRQVDAYGTMAPTGKVVVTWLDGRTTEIQTPDWLTVELLLSLQPKQTKPALLEAIVASTLPLPTVPTDAAQTQPGEPFIGQSDADLKALEDKQRVQKKLAEKLKSSGSDWVNVRDLLKTALGSADDRKLGQLILTAAIKKGVLQHEERENPNKTKSYFVRVAPKS